MSNLSCGSGKTFSTPAAAFAALHAAQPTCPFVANVNVDVDTLDAGSQTLPVTINETPSENAWVVSPLTTYSRYALEETQRLAPRLLVPPLSALIGLAESWLMRAQLDRAVSINNWLVSTNIYPSLAEIDVNAVVASSLSRWPEHAIWFRSLNREQHSDWLNALRNAGFLFIPTRQVYLFRQMQQKGIKHQNLLRDLRLLNDTHLTHVTGDSFSDCDFVRSEALYAKLYLEKYSKLNPRYTARFMKAWHSAGLLEFFGFRDSTGQLCAVVGLFGQGSQLTAPIVGYDTTLPQSVGLYRLLMAKVLQVTRERDAELNLSAGAAHFKRLRGGEPAIEYSAVFGRHLPRSAQHTLQALSALTSRLGVPIMRRYQL